MNDLAGTWRGLRRSPGFPATAILTRAFGAGAQTAAFSAPCSLLLKALSYSEPGRLVEIHETGVDRKTRGDAAANLPDCARGLGARLIAFGLVVPLRKIQRYGIEPFDPANHRDRCGHSAGSQPGRFSRALAPRGAYRALWSF